MSIFKYTIKNSTTNVIKVNNLIFETINFFSLDLIKLIEEYLIYYGEYRNRKYTCDLDFLNLMSSGFYHTSNAYFESEKEERSKLVKPDQKINNHLFWHSHKAGWEDVATDCSESNELSINECSDIDYLSIRYRNRYNCEWNSDDNRNLEKTFQTRKDKFIHDLFTDRHTIIEELFFEKNNHKQVSTFWIDNKELCFDLKIENIEDCDSGDEADNEH